MPERRVAQCGGRDLREARVAWAEAVLRACSEYDVAEAAEKLAIALGAQAVSGEGCTGGARVSTAFAGAVLAAGASSARPLVAPAPRERSEERAVHTCCAAVRQRELAQRSAGPHAHSQRQARPQQRSVRDAEMRRGKRDEGVPVRRDALPQQRVAKRGAHNDAAEREGDEG